MDTALNAIELKLKAHVTRVNKTLSKLLSFNKEEDEYQHELTKVMRYAVLSGGKRYRSFFLTLAGAMHNLDKRDILTLGATMEMIHSYLIMQDDLPSMDNDDYRRNTITCHKKYGEDTTLMATNALLTMAFEIIADESNLSSIDKGKRNAIVKIMSKYAGRNGLIGGQYMSINFKKSTPSQSEVYRFRKLKSASLFIAGAEIISCIAPVTNAQKTALITAANSVSDLLNLYRDIEKWQSLNQLPNCDIEKQLIQSELLTTQATILIQKGYKEKNDLIKLLALCLEDAREAYTNAKHNINKNNNNKGMFSQLPAY